MRALRALPPVLLVAVALTACVSTADLGRKESSAPTPMRTADVPSAEPASCTRERSIDLAVGTSTDGLPGVDDVAMMEWTQTAYARGEGTCAPAGTQPGSLITDCSPAAGDDPAFTAPAEDMFAAGALVQTSARVRTETSVGAEFAYAASTWRFPSASDAAAAPLVDLIASCVDVVGPTTTDPRRWEVYEGDEPHLRLTVDGADVLLFRSLHVPQDGDATGLPATRSGLLSLAAVDALEEWWLSNASPREP